jgi:hypothetical protein
VTGTRRLLTFRLDRDFRQRLATRLAGEGRTMSEVVIFGLQLYVQRSARFTGPAVLEDSRPEESPDAGGLDASSPDASGPGASGPATTAVVGVGDLALPDQVASYLRDLRKSGQSDLLSATVARLHEVGWPLRPLATALGISRQAVQARVRQPVPDEVLACVPDVPPPAAVPRRRPAAAGGPVAQPGDREDPRLLPAARPAAARDPAGRHHADPAGLTPQAPGPREQPA